MTMTDPISDMLTRIRNANVAMHDDVRMPASKLKESLATVLQKELRAAQAAWADHERRVAGLHGRPEQPLTGTSLGPQDVEASLGVHRHPVVPGQVPAQETGPVAAGALPGSGGEQRSGLDASSPGLGSPIASPTRPTTPCSSP